MFNSIRPAAAAVKKSFQDKLQNIKCNGRALDDKIAILFALVGVSCFVRMVADFATRQTWSGVMMGVWSFLFFGSSFHAFYVEKLHIVVTETLCVVCVLMVSFQDLLTFGEYDMWMWLHIIVDVSFLCNVRTPIRIFVACFSALYILLKTIQDATDIGLYHIGEKLEYTDLNKPVSRGSDWVVNALLIRLSIFTGNCVLVYGLGQTALRLHNLMSDVCADLSSLHLDSAEMHLLKFPERTAGVASLARLTENLRKYKPYLPDALVSPTAVHLPKEIKRLALLQVSLRSGGDDATKLADILATTRMWRGAVHNYDSASALVVFDPSLGDTIDDIRGFWGIGRLIIVVECASGKPTIRTLNVGYGKEPIHLQTTNIPEPPSFFQNPLFYSTLGDGKVWFGNVCRDEMEACFDGVKGMQEGTIVVLKRSRGAVGLASGCALSIRDSYVGVEALKMVVVWEDCDVGNEGLGTVSGRGIELAKAVMEIGNELAATLLCSHGAVEYVSDVYTVKEVHAGPVDDGPVFEFCDANEITKLQRAEHALLENLPKNREILLTDLADATAWVPLGKGKTGKVFKATYTKTQQNIAVKELRLDDASEANVKNRISFLRELRHMNDLRFNNIVNFYGYAKKDGQIFLLMEYCKGILQHVVYDVTVTDQDRATIAISMGSSIAQALSYIHSRGKVHMDVAARNVLLTEEGSYKLSDFGLMHEEGEIAEMISYPWAPPEAITSSRVARYTYDVWSFAMLLYEVLSGGPPYGLPFSPGKVKEMITSGVLPVVPACVARNSDCAKIWTTIMEPCMVASPLARPSMSQLASLLNNMSPSALERDATTSSSTLQLYCNPAVSAYLDTYQSDNLYGTLPTYQSDNIYGTIPADYYPMVER
eukprot:TRINITY_DN6500_c0_g2_i1.p1 TRINITY_DN6500_c0_g2~~TRINITY_DN6500_c0_g2_i1.p1  ORF type:complete len:880 (+),score=126.77 TRINITY_DN6500_c0_g2_i1:49-2688(+)